MRLNPFDTSKIDVRSSRAGSRPGARRAGGVGCGALAIALIGAVVFGLDPARTLSVLSDLEQTSSSAGQGASSQSGDLTKEQICTSGPYAQVALRLVSASHASWA
ncbi:MAG: hypothetical protein AAFO28_05350 [Pseudomonadota bacterium]